MAQDVGNGFEVVGVTLAMEVATACGLIGHGYSFGTSAVLDATTSEAADV